VLKLIHGEDNVAVEGNSVTIKHTAKMPPRQAYVLDMLDGGTRIREVIPEGQLTTSGEVQFVHSDVIRYSVAIESLPVDGEVKAFSYIDSDSSESDRGGAEGE